MYIDLHTYRPIERYISLSVDTPTGQTMYRQIYRNVNRQVNTSMYRQVEHFHFPRFINSAVEAVSLNNLRIYVWKNSWISQAATDDECRHFACPEPVIVGVNLQVSYY